MRVEEQATIAATTIGAFALPIAFGNTRATKCAIKSISENVKEKNSIPAVELANEVRKQVVVSSKLPAAAAAAAAAAAIAEFRKRASEEDSEERAVRAKMA